MNDHTGALKQLGALDKTRLTGHLATLILGRVLAGAALVPKEPGSLLKLPGNSGLDQNTNRTPAVTE